MQEHSGLNATGTRSSLVTAVRRGAFIGVALSALVASASAEPESAQGNSALHNGIGQAVLHTDMRDTQAGKAKCKKSGQKFVFPIVTADAPGVLSSTWSVVPPSGVASVAGTTSAPWVTPPSGIFWEQAVPPPPPAPPVNPINEQYGVGADFLFKTSFGPLPPPSSLLPITVSGSFSVDNDGSVWVNNHSLANHQAGYCPPSYGPPPAGFGAKCFITTFPLSAPSDPANGAFHAGMNTVILDVHNHEFISGFMIDGTITAICK